MKKLRLAVSFGTAVLALGTLYAQVLINPNPSREVGHPRLTLSTSAPNLVEGREFNSPQGVAVDTSVTPPALYVADTGNNRVLGWRNAALVANGAPADVVIGQRDKYTTSAQGPSTTLSTGAAAPTGLAVDAAGNLYVADSGNNRILRFPKPFSQPDDLKLPDMVIGQKNFNASGPNQGDSVPSAKTIRLSFSSGTYSAYLVFDAQGNLYFSDAGNNRILRYNAAVFAAGTNEPAAELVLGQSSFDANKVEIPNSDPRYKQAIAAPSGIALDQAGRLFVCDQLNRVLVYLPPFSNGKAATRVMGVVTVQQGQPYPVNETSLGTVSGGNFVPPGGVFTIGNLPFVIDTPNHRILRFQAYDQWAAETTSVFSPPANGVMGQPDFNGNKANRGQKEPSANTLNAVVAAAFGGNMLFVADAFNHRVLVFGDPSQTSDLSNFGAQRVLGQDRFEFNTVNLIEGREFNFGGRAGAAVDFRSDPPRLYVADTVNNRILGFKDARKVRPGDKADLAIGQGDGDFRFYRSLINYPSSDPLAPNQSGLYLPMGLAVDTEGNLWVADSNNSRVLRFPRPFDKQQQAADIVLGQSSFTSKVTDATTRTMAAPYGLAFSNLGHLLVSDAAHSRVLLFEKDPAKGFQNGQAATKFFGQRDGLSSVAGSAINRLNSPRGIALDSGDRLYVCDSGNGRLMIFGSLYAQPQYDASAADQIRGLSSPSGVFVSATTGEIWVAEPGATQVRRWPDYDKLLPTGYQSNYAINAAFPTALTVDGFGNLLVAEATNRVDFFFPAFAITNAASGIARVAPGMIASLWPYGNTYGDQTQVFNELPNPLPLPATLADVQVLVNDKPAPLFFVSPGQINFQMPSSAPNSGTVDVLVYRTSKDQILGAATIGMDIASPALFTNDASGGGQVAALNQDNSRNTRDNPALKNQVIQLFGNGPGLVPGAPDDGTTPSGAVSTADPKPQVWIESSYVPPEAIQYSGLAPGLVGVWQINVKIPDKLAPLVPAQVPVFVLYRDRRSLEQGMKVTTIAVKP